MKDETEVLNFLKSEKPGWLEKVGIKYFYNKSRKERESGRRVEKAKDDDEMVRRVRNTTIFGVTVAFIMGGISAGGSVAVDQFFAADACATYLSASCIERFSWFGGVTLVLTLIEFYVLFWMGLHTVYHIARITGHSRLGEENDLFAIQLPNLLSRAALEIPDPVRSVMGIDPLSRVSKKKLLLLGVLYKLKIMLSNVLARMLLTRVLGKSVMKVSVEYISVFITGFWNALVIFKIAREARLRLFGNLLAKHIVTENITDAKLGRLSPAARIACLQAVGNSIVLTQNYHPNMLILLMRFSTLFSYKGGETLDDWEIFLENLNSLSKQERFFILDLLAVATAFDGKVSRLEREALGEAFGEHKPVYFKRIKRLKNLMLAGRLYQAVTECELDFEAG